MISEARSQHNDANNVNRTGAGAARRSDGYDLAARARHASTSFSDASENRPVGRPITRPAATVDLA